MVDKLTSDGLVRLMLRKHLPHIDRLEEFEKQFKVPSKDWYRSMQVLIGLATLLQKNETSQRLLDAQVHSNSRAATIGRCSAHGETDAVGTAGHPRGR